MLALMFGCVPSSVAVKEPKDFVVSNPGRVTFNQQSYCRIDHTQRFQPIRKVRALVSVYVCVKHDALYPHSRLHCPCPGCHQVLWRAHASGHTSGWPRTRARTAEGTW